MQCPLGAEDYDAVLVHGRDTARTVVVDVGGNKGRLEAGLPDRLARARGHSGDPLLVAVSIKDEDAFLGNGDSGEPRADGAGPGNAWSGCRPRIGELFAGGDAVTVGAKDLGPVAGLGTGRREQATEGHGEAGESLRITGRDSEH